MAEIESVFPAGRPKPAGHYSPGVLAEGFLFISGQLPVDSQGKPRSDLPFAAQAELALANVDEVLRAASCARGQLVQVRVYVDDIANWPEFNSLYAKWMGDHRPARCVVPVPKLHHDLKIEIEATAIVPRRDRP
jgi:reactive intermediate/imine deaminase